MSSVTSFAALLKGMDDNYAWLSMQWPDSRSVVISLSFDAQGEDKPLSYIRDWWCAYDLETRTFAVPTAFAEHNAKAFTTPRPSENDHGASPPSGQSVTCRKRPQKAGIWGANQYVQPETASTAAGHKCPDRSEARNSGKQL